MQALFLGSLFIALLIIICLIPIQNPECPKCRSKNTYVIEKSKHIAEIGCRNCNCIFPVEID